MRRIHTILQTVRQNSTKELLQLKFQFKGSKDKIKIHNLPQN